MQVTGEVLPCKSLIIWEEVELLLVNKSTTGQSPVNYPSLTTRVNAKSYYKQTNLLNE